MKTKEQILLETIENASLEEIIAMSEELHPVDLLEALQDYEGNSKDLLDKFPDEYIAMVIDEAELDEKYEILSLFPQNLDSRFT